MSLNGFGVPSDWDKRRDREFMMQQARMAVNLDPTWLLAEQAVVSKKRIDDRYRAGYPKHRQRCWSLIDQYNRECRNGGIPGKPSLGAGHYSTVYDEGDLVVKIGHLRDRHDQQDGWSHFARTCMENPHPNVVQVYAMHMNYPANRVVAVMRKYSATAHRAGVDTCEAANAVRNGVHGRRTPGRYGSLSAWFYDHFRGWEDAVDNNDGANFLVDGSDELVACDPFWNVPRGHGAIRPSASMTVEGHA